MLARYGVMGRVATLFAATALLAGLAGCGAGASPIDSPGSTARAVGEAAAQEGSTPTASPGRIAAPSLPFTVVASYPHDPSAWTQGLAYAGPDLLYEGTGDYINSSLREVQMSSGEVLRSVALPSPQFYGEGIAVLGETILQLTWKDGVGLVRRRSDLGVAGQFCYPATGEAGPQEGWGITTDGTNLYVSDGSASVYVADAQRTLDDGELAVTDVITVQFDGRPVERLNELEYVEGEIFANVWQADRIVRFHAATGEVNGVMDISGLLTPEEKSRADTPNGIAADPATGELLVTGKRWPRLFALRLG